MIVRSCVGKCAVVTPASEGDISMRNHVLQAPCSSYLYAHTT